MTDAELLELSIRARLAQAQSEDVVARFTRGKTVHLDGFKIITNNLYLVQISRNGEPIFWHLSHRDPLSKPDLPPQIKDITCAHNGLAKRLLSVLRTSQVLDNLARIE